MKASHNLAGVSVTFDEDRLVPNAGLIAPALLAQRLGIAKLIESRVKLAAGPGAANGGAKAVTVLGAMLAGGDSIEDVDVLRAGAAADVFDDIRAPSTIGTWLRAFRWSNIRQLDAVLRETLVRGWEAGLGPADLSAPLTIDVDSSVCQTYGTKKQGGEVRLHQSARLPPRAGHLRRHRRGAARAHARRQRRLRPRCEDLCR